MLRRLPWVLSAVLLLPAPARPCSLCQGGVRPPTLREEAAQRDARLIFHGVVTKSGLRPDGSGSSEMQILDVLRPDAALAGHKVVTIPRYIHVADPKAPPRFLIFCGVRENGDLDPYRGVPLKSAASADYVKGLLALPPQRDAQLLFFFRWLENADPEVADDAFLEFAKAADREIGQVAARLDAGKLRAWLKDPNTPVERLSLYAFLLGACGGDADAEFLREQLTHTDSERVLTAYDGLLGAYIQRRPAEGWRLAEQLVGDGKAPLQVRLAAVRTLRLFMGWQPEACRPAVLRCAAALLRQGELADLAVEDLRRWKAWDLTTEVLACYGRQGVDSPLIRQAVIRYALVCPPDDRTRAFLADRRRLDADLVRQAEESLLYEKR
jgi:hypothetical protein